MTNQIGIEYQIENVLNILAQSLYCNTDVLIFK